MKKLFCILLVVLLLFNTTSCVQQTSEKTEKEISSSETTKLETNLETTPFGRYDPPIEITYAKVFSSTILETLAMHKETEEDNRWTRYYEEELGIKLKLLWSSPNNDDFNTKLSLSISSGTVPDYIPFGQNYNTIYQFAEAGLLADLTDVLDTYAYDGVKEGLKDAGKEALYPATIDGRLYALPQIIGGENQSHCFLWLRKDWLDNLGLQPPKTIEELDVVMDSFVNKDPDGNGEADTIGLAASSDILNITRGFFYSYHAYPLIWVEGEENKLVYGSVMDTVKPALAQLREYYSKGYLPEEFYTLKGINEMIVQGKVGGYIGTQTAFGTGSFDAAWEFNNNANWVPYILPTSDGKKVTPVSAHNSANFYGMSANCKHPEVIVKFMNLHVRTLWDPEYTSEELNYYYGNDKDTGRGVWHLSLVPYEPSGKNSAKAAACKRAYETKDMSVLNIPEYKIMYDYLVDWYDNGKMNYKWLKVFGFEESANALMPYYLKNNLFVYNKFYTAPTPTLANVKTALDTMEKEAFLKIIIGEKPIDYFDTFVKNWYDSGGKASTDEVNEWYDKISK